MITTGRGKHGQPPDSVLLQCRKEALAHPNDTKALFRWGYAAYRAASQVEVAPATAYLKFETPGSIYSVQSFMMKRPSPSYQYARLLFLLCNFNSPDPQTEGLGKRLLQHNPNDKEVKYAMLAIRSQSLDTSVRQQAMHEAEYRAQQGSPEGCLILADMYGSMWNISRFPPVTIAKTQPIADKAIAALRRYIQLTSPESGKPRKEG